MSSYIKGHCVYLLKEFDTELYKIGRTVYLKERKASLETERGCSLLVAGTVSVPNRGVAIELEGRLHRHFTKYRVYGEWFCLGDVGYWFIFNLGAVRK